MINKNIYLDNHSSTQIDERVYKKMVPFLTNIFGNPHSESHSHGWISNKFVDLSRLKIAKAIKSKKGRKITVEVDNLKQFKKINSLKFDRVLFDNMNPKNIKAGVKLAKKLYETEASGGVNLKNVKQIARTGVDRISIGALTRNINSLDLKLEI